MCCRTDTTTTLNCTERAVLVAAGNPKCSAAMSSTSATATFHLDAPMHDAHDKSRPSLPSVTAGRTARLDAAPAATATRASCRQFIRDVVGAAARGHGDDAVVWTTRLLRRPGVGRAPGRDEPTGSFHPFGCDAGAVDVGTVQDVWTGQSRGLIGLAARSPGRNPGSQTLRSNCWYTESGSQTRAPSAK
jgi:hypothetical protein